MLATHLGPPESRSAEAVRLRGCPPAAPPLGGVLLQVGDPAAPHYGEPAPPHRRLRSQAGCARLRDPLGRQIPRGVAPGLEEGPRGRPSRGGGASGDTAAGGRLQAASAVN